MRHWWRLREDTVRERADIHLPIGGVYATRDPVVIKTVLGSCISVCLRDPRERIGGMNHFMLPTRLGREEDDRSSCYGVYAMDLLVNELMKLGADRGRLQAKVFGAAHLLGVAHGSRSVATQNSAFIVSYLETEGVPLLSQDLGGILPRTVYFYPDTGRVLVKQFGRQKLGRLVLEEQRYQRKVIRTIEAPADVTLFPTPDRSLPRR